MRDLIRDLVDQAPNMTQDHWDDLADLARKRECVPAFLGWVLGLAQAQADGLINCSTSTPEGREQSDLAKGAARGYQALVGNACDLMGDAHEMEVRAEVEEIEEKPRRAPRRRTTAKKTTRRRK
jgi:hypothetical protein